VTDPSPDRPASVRAVEYKGEPLDSERGPGLGCFRFQLVVLALLIVLTPLSVAWNWPSAVSAALLFGVIVLLLLAGQTIIFLLRLVAADRRAAGRRRPLASATKTVGELEDEARAGEEPVAPDEADGSPGPEPPTRPGAPSESEPPSEPPVRQ
jgi:hypothetical protein